MKHALLVGSMVVALSNVAAAQGTNIHTCLAENGSNFSLDAGTQVFNYHATISSAAGAYVATLEVFHNGTLKSVTSQVVLPPSTSYLFSAPVGMGSWGLKPGDQVTFQLKVVKMGSSQILAIHTVTGDVTPAEPGPTTE